MAYFSNGSEAMVFEEECSNCILGEEACPIAWVQLEYNYEACNNKTASAILNHLVKQEEDTWRFLGCRMKSLLEDSNAKEK